MDYKPLKGLKYKDIHAFASEKEKRLNSLDTLFLPIDINNNASFVVPCFEIINLIQNIYHENTQLQRIKKRLPTAAIDCMLNDCLIKEIMLTNSIEGVNSTRKEISDIIDSKKNEETKKRLAGMVHKYQMLINDDLNANEYFTSQGLRRLFDDIVSSEMPQNEQPDGQFFRKDPVDVRSATDRIKHQGLYPEDKIIDAVNKLEIIAKDERIPWLIRIALIHYFVGYIHPFYNGNGRISRFISSCLLRIQLGKIPATYLSYSIKNKISDYYRAFDICNDKNNAGDLTPFVIMFLELVFDAVHSANQDCKENHERLNYFENLLSKYVILSDDEKSLAFLLVQFMLFAPEQEFSETKIMKISGLTRYNIAANYDRLVEKGIPVTIERKGRSKIYSIDLDLLDTLG